MFLEEAVFCYKNVNSSPRWLYFYKFIYLFNFGGPRWVFVAARGLFFLVVATGATLLFLYIYLFIFGCVGSLLLHADFL